MDKTILVVDDEKPIADILQFNLKKEGYQVICAYDGDEALEKVEEDKTRFNATRYYVTETGWYGSLPRNSKKIRFSDHYVNSKGF